MPSYEHLLEFLEKRAICAPAAPQKVASTPRQSNRDTINPSSNRHQARSHAFVSTADGSDQNNHRDKKRTTRTSAGTTECPVCHDIHSIWCCERFNSMSVESRLAASHNSSLCQNCLRPGHDLDACKRGFCRICNQQHHTLLHQPRQATDRIEQVATSD